MTVVGGVPLDSSFRVSLYNGTPPAGTPANGGWAMDGQYAYISIAAVAAGAPVNGGFAYTDQGQRYATTDAPSATSRTIGGVAVSATGQMHVSNGGVIAYFNGGLPVTTTGAVAATIPGATDFDGSTYATRGADLDGIADGKQGIFSCWFQLDNADGTSAQFMANSNTRISILRINSDNTIAFLAQSSAPATILNMRTASAVTSGSGWRHIMASWDMTDTAKRHIYLDGVQSESFTTHTNTDIDYTTGNYSIGALVTSGSRFNGCLSQIFFHTSYLDLSSDSNRLKFRSAAGSPVSLGADGSLPLGAQPLIYFPEGDPTDNKGSGGNFSVAAGALTDCSTTP